MSRIENYKAKSEEFLKKYAEWESAQKKSKWLEFLSKLLEVLLSLATSYLEKQAKK